MAAISFGLARLVGPTLIVMALSLLLNRAALLELAEQIGRDWGLIYMSGVLLLVAGIAMVERHNVWRGWPVLITIIGWLAILGGLARMLFFRQLAAIAASVTSHAPAILVPSLALLLIGCFLTLKGFRLVE